MDVFEAIADPTRREMLELLSRSPQNAGEVARRFPVSRPAISRHLRVLRGAGLVTVEQSGRERKYRVNTAALAAVDAWLAQFRDQWASRLDALETEVHRTRRERERQSEGIRQHTPVSKQEKSA